MKKNVLKVKFALNERFFFVSQLYHASAEEKKLSISDLTLLYTYRNVPGVNVHVVECTEINSVFHCEFDALKIFLETQCKCMMLVHSKKWCAFEIQGLLLH